jgi:hypothetical protein
MAQFQQDPTDPTGVRDLAPQRYAGGPDGSVVRARTRKANAAVQMRLAGATWPEIAQTLGYPTPRTALVAVERTLEKQLDETDRAKMRSLAGARLERLLRSVWTKAVDPDSPEQMIAVSKAREILADHRKLFGLDAPTEVIVHNPSAAELEEWVAGVVALSTTLPPEPDVIAGTWTEPADEPEPHEGENSDADAG